MGNHFKSLAQPGRHQFTMDLSGLAESLHGEGGEPTYGDDYLIQVEDGAGPTGGAEPGAHLIGDGGLDGTYRAGDDQEPRSGRRYCCSESQTRGSSRRGAPERRCQAVIGERRIEFDSCLTAPPLRSWPTSGRVSICSTG